MVKCTFCKNELRQGTGKIFVTLDGSVRHYCSLKCEKNHIKLKRNPTATKWTKAYKKGN